MAVTRLVLNSFRNINSADVVLQPGVNLFCGANGGGKTSLLEAVHMLACGRSFRSRQNQSVINRDMGALTVFGQLSSGFTLGIEKRRDGGGRARINQSPAESSSQLAACLPLQIINSDSFAALDGGPSVRRQLLDWSVFHVEHSFAQHWKSYQIALRQRNALLRRGKIAPDLLAVWEEQLVEAGQVVDGLRSSVFERLRILFEQLLRDLPQQPFSMIESSYRSGWKRDLPLAQALVDSREGDLAQGHTRVGPHRADLRFSIRGEAVHSILSRGQQKMLVCALRAAMAMLISESREKPVFLVDDLPSELDADNQLQFAHWVSRCSEQVLVTGIDPGATRAPWLELAEPWNKPAMFHVEHGQIKAEST